jgi:hypothetical protein
MTSTLVATVFAGSIVVALGCVGAGAAIAVLMAVKAGGRREESLDAHDALSVSRFTIPVSVVVAIPDSGAPGSQGSQGSPGSRAETTNEAITNLLDLDYPEFEVVVIVEQPDPALLDSLRAAWTLDPKEF